MNSTSSSNYLYAIENMLLLIKSIMKNNLLDSKSLMKIIYDNPTYKFDFTQEKESSFNLKQLINNTITSLNFISDDTMNISNTLHNKNKDESNLSLSTILNENSQERIECYNFSDLEDIKQTKVHNFDGCTGCIVAINNNEKVFSLDQKILIINYFKSIEDTISFNYFSISYKAIFDIHIDKKQRYLGTELISYTEFEPNISELRNNFLSKYNLRILNFKKSFFIKCQCSSYYLSNIIKKIKKMKIQVFFYKLEEKEGFICGTIKSHGVLKPLNTFISLFENVEITLKLVSNQGILYNKFYDSDCILSKNINLNYLNMLGDFANAVDAAIGRIQL